MQYTIIPTKIQKQIDQIQRNFIWRTTNEGKKLHLINWKTITSTKNLGGLGLNNANSENTALLSGLTSRILSNPTTPWASILINKYSNSRSKNHSFIWKGILKGWTICSKAILWQPRQNFTLNLWDTHWIPKYPPLRNCIEGPLNECERKLQIRNIYHNGNWSFSRISFQMPPKVINNINSITQPLSYGNYDKHIWSLNNNGQFTSKNCYQLINNTIPASHDFSWI